MSLTVKTKGDSRSKWVAVITEGSDWASLDPNSSVITASGSVTASGDPGFKVYFPYNHHKDIRNGKLVVNYTDGYEVELTFAQLGQTDNPTYDRAWAEQPYYAQNKNYIYKTYYTTLSGAPNVTRNYSVCFDTEKRCSRWVAYPVYQKMMDGQNSYKVGTTTNGRTNAWCYDDAVTEYAEGTTQNNSYKILSKYVSSIDTYDTYTLPIIPQSKQQYIIDTYGTGHNRGHMLPSASRYNTWKTNAQTFYSTNMMPQDGTLNSGSWSTVEGWVRQNKCSDTLFVITGTLFEDGKTITDRKGRVIGVPSHCYKLLLRTKNGNTGKRISEITNASDIKAIGFIFANNSSGNINPKNAVVSIAEIEARSGFSFYRNLNEAIADKVKAQKDFSAWNFN